MRIPNRAAEEPPTVQIIDFCSDSPWTDAAAEIAWLRRLPLNEGVAEAILGGNAARLLAG